MSCPVKLFRAPSTAHCLNFVLEPVFDSLGTAPPFARPFYLGRRAVWAPFLDANSKACRVLGAIPKLHAGFC